MIVTAAIACGFLLDCVLADPVWMPHPVVWMGKIITALERCLRRRLPQTQQGERTGGRILAVILPVGTALVTGGVCALAWRIHPLFFFVVETIWCWQALAARGLQRESLAVYRQLEPAEDLPAARRAVARIVGRDTQKLTAEGVTKAAVETVAENFSDGVIAPLMYLLVGGAPLGLVYKSINTMDSMVGYKNDTYRWFGRAAARLDDAANYLPARIAALFWIIGAGLTGHSVQGTWRIWRRDCRNHASPNSAQTESACAGALGVQLAGTAYYFGERYDKPTIGDAARAVVPQDIVRTNQMMYAATVVAVAVGLLLRVAVCLALGGIV